MKRFFSADIHLSGYQSDIINSESFLTQRLHNIMKTLDYGANYCRTHGIRFWDIGGDLNNDKDVIYTLAQDAFKNFILKNKDIHFTIISGNHDLSSTGEGQSSSISVFEGYDNVTAITKLTYVDKIAFLPYSNKLISELKKIKEDDESCQILISHFGVNEGMLQSGLSIVADVKISHLKQFKLVLVGHYHKPQDITNEYTRLYYVGNPSHLSWNDKNEQKRFIVYDTETLEVESIPITGFIEYKEFVVNNRQEYELIADEAEKLNNLGHHVKIRRNYQDTEQSTKKETSGVMIIDKPAEVDITNRGIDLSQTDSEKIRKYMEIKNIDKELQDKHIKILQEEGIL
jgi:DNA repair exonuclease SbcCD nuclease subunit